VRHRLDELRDGRVTDGYHATMLTADTITDEQIRELRASVLYNCTPFESKSDEETEMLDLCEAALYGLHAKTARDSVKYKARARCAAILSARAKKAQNTDGTA
jgi:hypothetical protein